MQHSYSPELDYIVNGTYSLCVEVQTGNWVQIVCPGLSSLTLFFCHFPNTSSPAHFYLGEEKISVSYRVVSKCWFCLCGPLQVLICSRKDFCTFPVSKVLFSLYSACFLATIRKLCESIHFFSTVKCRDLSTISHVNEKKINCRRMILAINQSITHKLI